MCTFLAESSQQVTIQPGRLASGSQGQVPLTFLPDEGEGPARMAVGDQPRLTPWAALPPLARSFSPARLNAAGEGPPPQLAAPGRPRLHYAEREDPGGGHPEPRPQKAVLAGAELWHARSQDSGAVNFESGARRAPTVARTPVHKPFAMAPKLSLHCLTNRFLRWCQRGSADAAVRRVYGEKAQGIQPRLTLGWFCANCMIASTARW